jgi:WD40 repeat protein
MSSLIARPAGVEPSSWPWTPADVYSLVCTAMLTLTLVGGACFVYALRQYWVDWKVNRRSDGITGLYNFLSFITFIIGLIGSVFVLRFLYFSAYVLPARGWPEGAIWSKYYDNSEVTQVGFSDDGRLFYVRTSSSPYGSRSGSAYGTTYPAGTTGGTVQAYTHPGGLPRSGSTTSNIGPQSRRIDSGPPLAMTVGPYTVEQQRNVPMTQMRLGNNEKSTEGLVVLDQSRTPHWELPHDVKVRCVAASGDGHRLLTGDNGGVIRVWDLTKPAPLTPQALQSPDGSVAPVVCLAISPDGLFAASGSEDGTVRIWDLNAGVERRVLSRSGRAVRQLALCTGAYRVVAVEASAQGSSREDLVLWDVSLGKVIKRLTLNEYGSSGSEVRLALSPDGRYALVATYTNTVQLWRLPEE